MTIETSDNAQVKKNPEQFIQQIAQNAVQLMAKQLLSRNSNFDSFIFEKLFKKATGRVLREVAQSDKMHDDFENMMVNALIQELSNSVKNIQISLLKSSGLSSDQVALKMREHYSARTGLSSQVERIVKELLAHRHIQNNNKDNNHNRNQDVDSNQNSMLGFYRHKIQRYLRSVLDGAMQSAMRQATRVATESSLGQLEIAPTAHLESFALYRKLHQDQSLARNSSGVKVMGQKEHMVFRHY